MAAFQDDRGDFRKDFENHKKGRADKLRQAATAKKVMTTPSAPPAAELEIRRLRAEVAKQKAIIEKIRSNTTGMRSRSNRMSSVPNNVLRDFCTDILRAIEGK